jgi:DNA topoisomerase-1
MEVLTSLSHQEILKIDRDYEKVAEKIDLVYLNDSAPGIVRIKKGSGFTYKTPSRKPVSKTDLERIRKLVIPPAWTKVWICTDANGHIQATGIDVRGRKQYKYHPLWTAARSETKFHRLYEFGKVLPTLRLKIEEDLSKKTLNHDKVIATVLSLMERTYIRIGGEDYEKLYGSHGMTTLKDKHVEVDGSNIRFTFSGKKGKIHEITLKNPRLARVVKQCRDIPGKELFQYYDENGDRRAVDSGEVNAYIKEATKANFTAKDFRTWAGSLNLLRALKTVGNAASDAEKKKNLVAAIDEVSRKLGNTRTVCRKYYIHPKLIELYEQDGLQKYIKELDDIELPDRQTDLTSDEKILLKILKSLIQ